MATVREIEGFLAQAKKDYAAVSKKISNTILKLDTLRLAQADNEHLQHYLMGQIKDLGGEVNDEL